MTDKVEFSTRHDTRGDTEDVTQNATRVATRAVVQEATWFVAVAATRAATENIALFVVWNAIDHELADDR